MAKTWPEIELAQSHVLRRHLGDTNNQPRLTKKY
jgi:hypothetical protein